MSSQASLGTAQADAQLESAGTGGEGVKRANRQLLAKLLVITAAMFGLGFAMVPFYDQLCRVSGIRELFRNGEPAATNTQVDVTRSVGIEFDSNTQRLNWGFRPVEGHVDVHPGEVRQVVYEVTNKLDRPVTAQAVPSYAPQRAGAYFTKLECFCFNQQTLGPHESRRMPVVFVVDPKLPKDIPTVTLSYTFFEVAGTGTGAAAATAAKQG
jgi:cytochrome c oxidase assembly protein subunit 11